MYEIIYSLARPECVGRRQHTVVTYANNRDEAIQQVKASDPDFGDVVKCTFLEMGTVVFIK